MAWKAGNEIWKKKKKNLNKNKTLLHRVNDKTKQDKFWFFRQENK